MDRDVTPDGGRSTAFKGHVPCRERCVTEGLPNGWLIWCGGEGFYLQIGM